MPSQVVSLFATLLMLSIAHPVLAASPVVELFTSEGCSSCPPADDLIARLQASQSGREGEPVILLAWHVDYWDHLGWADPFASAEHTQRQRTVCRRLESRSLYTPQAVVNGRTHFVGSDEKALNAALRATSNHESATSVTLSAMPGSRPGSYELRWKVLGTPEPKADLQVDAILTEDELVSHVERGENAGRTLRHVGVVRAAQVRRLAQGGEGRTVLVAPDGFRAGRARAVVVIREEDGVGVLAAASVPLQ